MRRTVPATTAVDAFGASIRGGRARNEDAFLVLDDLHEVVRRRGAGNLFAVADGLGGHFGGQVASRLATDTLIEAFDTVAESERTSPDEALQDLFLRANRRILDRASAEPLLSEMGTTLTALLLRGDRVGFAHVGDSRLYRIRENRIDLLTTDQNLGQRMRTEGSFRPEEYDEGPLRGALFAYLGKEPLAVQRGSLSPKSGDRFLLATDGWVNAIEEAEILSRSCPWQGARRFVDETLRLVENRNPRDNATIVAFALGMNGR